MLCHCSHGANWYSFVMDIHAHKRSASNKQQQSHNLVRLFFLTGEDHTGELCHALSWVGGTIQSQLSRPISSGHHISMRAPTTEETSTVHLWYWYQQWNFLKERKWKNQETEEKQGKKKQKRENTRWTKTRNMKNAASSKIPILFLHTQNHQRFPQKKREKEKKKMKNAAPSKIPIVWLYTPNPQQFPGFIVGDVKISDENIDGFHVFFFFRNLSLHRRTPTTHLGDSHLFPEDNWHLYWTYQKTYILLVKIAGQRL